MTKEAKQPKIIQINAVTGLTGNFTIFGLGDNNKVYLWNAAVGMWVNNWNAAPPIAPPIPLNRQQRRAKKKG